MPEFGRPIHKGEVYVHRGEEFPTNALVILDIEGDKVTFIDTGSLNERNYLKGIKETMGKRVLEDFPGAYELATPAQAKSVYSELKEQHDSLRVKMNLLEAYAQSLSKKTTRPTFGSYKGCSAGAIQ